ncbi:hypothetical protein Tco_1179425, partial [Tanacetum coccineum]
MFIGREGLAIGFYNMGFPGPRKRGDMSLTFKRCGNFDPFIAKTDATSTTSALEKILSRNG